MNPLSRLAASLEYRVERARVGIVSPRSLDPNSVRIGRRRIQMHCPEGEVAKPKREVGGILYEDWFRLGEFRKLVHRRTSERTFRVCAR